MIQNNCNFVPELSKPVNFNLLLFYRKGTPLEKHCFTLISKENDLFATPTAILQQVQNISKSIIWKLTNLMPICNKNVRQFCSDSYERTSVELSSSCFHQYQQESGWNCQKFKPFYTKTLEGLRKEMYFGLVINQYYDSQS